MNNESKIQSNLQPEVSLPYYPIPALFIEFRNCRDIPCTYVCIYVYPRHDFSTAYVPCTGPPCPCFVPLLE